jgi:hypothetical protein
LGGESRIARMKRSDHPEIIASLLSIMLSR